MIKTNEENENTNENFEERLREHVERDLVSPNEEVIKSMVEKIHNSNRNFPEYIRKRMEKLRESPPREFDNEDDIAKGLLNDLKDTIKRDLESKENTRKVLTRFLIIAFSIMGICTILLVAFSMNYDTKIVLAALSGFFINVISLVLVLLKYMFSPSKEIYDYTLGIFKRKSGE